MQYNIFDFKTCCFCVPLRHGILILGYMNLLFNLCVICVEGLEGYIITSHNLMMYRAVGYFKMSSLLYLFEIFFNVVLLVGAHIKKARLLKIYYFYGIFATVAAFFAFFVLRYDDKKKEFYVDYLDICLAITGLVLNVYLLLLIRAELQKLKLEQEQFNYENNISEVVLEPPNSGNPKTPCKI